MLLFLLHLWYCSHSQTYFVDLFPSIHDPQSQPFIVRVEVLPVLFLSFRRYAFLLIPRSRRVRNRALSIFLLAPVRVFKDTERLLLQYSTVQNRITPWF